MLTFNLKKITLWQGDCLERMKDIPTNSIDMVLADLPYGTTACKWDIVLPFDRLWSEYRRVCKDDAAIVLFGSQPFTSLLVSSNLSGFKYEWIYKKTAGSNFATVKHQPFKEHENVVVFGTSKKRVRYFPQMEDRHGGEIGKKRKAARLVSIEKCQTEVYGGIKHDRDTRNYGELRYPSSVQLFNNRKQSDRGLHPTQKPVAIMEYLIRTYTSEGDVVLDNCMGSGTTGVACVNTGRRFVGIELNNEYFNVARKRISEATEC